jgi:prefoldin subunit 5
MFSLKILLTEKEELEDLVEQYEASMSNATSLRFRIMEIVIMKSTLTTNIRKIK